MIAMVTTVRSQPIKIKLKDFSGKEYSLFKGFKIETMYVHEIRKRIKNHIESVYGSIVYVRERVCRGWKVTIILRIIIIIIFVLYRGTIFVF